MTLPVMEPDLWECDVDAGAVGAAVDAGPFSSLCFGERMAFDNPETLVLLGACAAWTSRVRLVTTVIVPQLHDPVMLAKALATADRLSGGRLTVGLGVGGREEDYRAVGADVRRRRPWPGMASRVAVMKRVWAGEKVTEAVRPVGPPPVQPGGPPLLVGTMGPKTIRVRLGLGRRPRRGDAGPVGVRLPSSLFDLARSAWAAAGRGVPRLTTSFWFALDSGDGSGPGAGAPAPAPLHELAAGLAGRRHGAHHRVRRHRGRAAVPAAAVRGHRLRRGPADPHLGRRLARWSGWRRLAGEL